MLIAFLCRFPSAPSSPFISPIRACSSTFRLVRRAGQAYPAQQGPPQAANAQHSPNHPQQQHYIYKNGTDGAFGQMGNWNGGHEPDSLRNGENGGKGHEGPPNGLAGYPNQYQFERGTPTSFAGDQPANGGPHYTYAGGAPTPPNGGGQYAAASPAGATPLRPGSHSSAQDYPNSARSPARSKSVESSGGQQLNGGRTTPARSPATGHGPPLPQPGDEQAAYGNGHHAPNGPSAQQQASLNPNNSDQPFLANTTTFINTSTSITSSYNNVNGNITTVSGNGPLNNNSSPGGSPSPYGSNALYGQLGASTSPTGPATYQLLPPSSPFGFFGGAQSVIMASAGVGLAEPVHGMLMSAGKPLSQGSTSPSSMSSHNSGHVGHLDSMNVAIECGRGLAMDQMDSSSLLDLSAPSYHLLKGDQNSLESHHHQMGLMGHHHHLGHHGTVLPPVSSFLLPSFRENAWWPLKPYPESDGAVPAPNGQNGHDHEQREYSSLTSLSG